MLLDADATAFGNEIPAEGPLTMGGDAPAGLYDAFEYKIPVNADGSTTTSNVVVNNTVTIQVPAGTYDWCLTNPTPGDRIWIASNQGNVGGRADDYEFVAGNTYNFTVYLLGQNDATDVEIIGGGAPNTPVPPTENPNTPEPGTTTGWGFETDPFAEGWTIRDDDGDGYNWEWMDASGSNYNVYEGTHCMASASFQNNPFGGGTALNPDNWLISPAFTAGKHMSSNRIIPAAGLYKGREQIAKQATALERDTLFGYQWNSIYKASIIRENNIRFCDSVFYEDYFFNLDFIRHAGSLATLDSAGYHYFKRVNGSITNRFAKDYFELSYKRVKSMYEFCIENKISDRETGNILAGRLLRYTLSALARNNNPLSDMNAKDRKKWFEEVCNMPLYSSLLPGSDSGNFVFGILKRAIINHNGTIALLLGKFVYAVRR